jgi:tetratricopeptide (TPR) repeat protein
LARALRYNFIVGLVALSAALAAAGGWKYARASAPVSGPIVLISIDGLRADHLPAYGYRGVQTPAIDRLAADGVVFEHAYSHVPQSLPAHSAILTGRLPFETGVRDSVGFTVKESERLLAEILRDRGYSTAAVVSTFELGTASGISQGFQFFDDTMAAAAPAIAVGAVARDRIDSEHVAEHWLKSAGTERVFLFIQLRLDQPDDLAPYDESVAATDETVGRFVGYLKAHQLYDQSTIVLVASYGEGLGDHKEQTHGLFVYDEALHVPLIVKLAAGQSAGHRVDDVVQHVDLMPTILDFAKAPIPGNIQGRSLKALLDGTGHLTGRAVYSESLYGYYHFGWAPLRTITDGRYRYIAAPREEFYDLAADQGEQENLAADPGHAEAMARLKAQLAKLSGEQTAAAPGEVANSDRDRFSALGYVGEQPEQAADAGAVDPKDKVAVVEGYRAAVDMAFNRRWSEATQALQAILRTEPQRADIWDDVGGFALRSNRLDVALDAYKHVAMLKPDDEVAAARVHQVKEFADARTLFSRQRYKAALPLFEETIDDLLENKGRPIADLHYYAGETLARLDRHADAQAELFKELEDFPDNLKARTELAKLSPSNK